MESTGKLQAELVEVEIYGNETAVSDVMEKKTDEVREKPVIVMWIVIGVGIILLAATAAVIVLQKRRKKNRKNEDEAPKKE